MYVTGPPCHDCVSGIIQAGIIRIVWPRDNPLTVDEEQPERWRESFVVSAKNVQGGQDHDRSLASRGGKIMKFLGLFFAILLAAMSAHAVDQVRACFGPTGCETLHYMAIGDTFRVNFWAKIAEPTSTGRFWGTSIADIPAFEKPAGCYLRAKAKYNDDLIPYAGYSVALTYEITDWFEDTPCPNATGYCEARLYTSRGYYTEGVPDPFTPSNFVWNWDTPGMDPFVFEDLGTALNNWNAFGWIDFAHDFTTCSSPPCQYPITFPSASQLTRGIFWEDGTCSVEGTPTVATITVIVDADSDGDGVIDVRDNCVDVANPAASYPPYRTTSGGQLDDDYDGYGNACDGKFGTGGSIVTALDTIQYKTAINKPVDPAEPTSICGSPPGSRTCDQFDLDEVSPVITALDTIAFKAMLNLPVGPKCGDCPLACVGDACP